MFPVSVAIHAIVAQLAAESQDDLGRFGNDQRRRDGASRGKLAANVGEVAQVVPRGRPSRPARQVPSATAAQEL